MSATRRLRDENVRGMNKARLAVIAAVAVSAVAVPSAASAGPHVKVFDGRTGQVLETKHDTAKNSVGNIR